MTVFFILKICTNFSPPKGGEAQEHPLNTPLVGGWGHVPQKFEKKYFSGTHEKFGQFVKFSYIHFHVKMSCPQS